MEKFEPNYHHYDVKRGNEIVGHINVTEYQKGYWDGTAIPLAGTTFSPGDYKGYADLERMLDDFLEEHKDIGHAVSIYGMNKGHYKG